MSGISDKFAVILLSVSSVMSEAKRFSRMHKYKQGLVGFSPDLLVGVHRERGRCGGRV